MKTTFKCIASSVCAVAIASSMLVASTFSTSALEYDGSSSYESSQYYKKLTDVNLTGDQRADIVEVAKSQVGYCESTDPSELSGQTPGEGNNTEYGYWYGFQDAWCAMFVSWCANVAEIDTSIIPKTADTISGLNWFIKEGQAYSRKNIEEGNYIPQAGDIIYFEYDGQDIADHVGIVTSYLDGKFRTIEGNSSDIKVNENSYLITDPEIAYICKPDYKNAAKVTLNISTLSLVENSECPLWATISGNKIGSEIVSWTSSDPKVAKVTQFGLVRAVAPGTATITVELKNGNKATCVVTVNAPDPNAKATIKFKISTLSLGINSAYTLRVFGNSRDHVSWTSSNPRVAEVTQFGKVVARSRGTSIITAKLANGNKATCVVAVDNDIFKGDVRVNEKIVMLDKTTLSLQDGYTYTLKATITPINTHTNDGRIVSWTSSDPRVATVTKYGKIIANAPGTAKITVRIANGKKDTCIVKVTKARTLPPLFLGDGSTYNLDTITNGKKIVSCVSSNERVATVTKSGKVTAIKLGKSTITVWFADGSRLTYTVFVEKATVKFKQSNLLLFDGNTYTLETTTNGSKIVSWTSSDERVATVTQEGEVTAIAPGTAKITVKLANGNRDTCTVFVEKATVKFKQSNLLLFDGNIDTLYTTTNGSKIVSWTSSDEKVATVTQEGEVTAIAPGTAKITVKLANGNRDTCTVTVDKAIVTLNKTSLETIEGRTDILKTTTNGSKIVSWTSSDEKVATVKDGKVTAKSLGIAEITVWLANGNRAVCIVRVNKAIVTLNKTRLKMIEGSIDTLEAIYSGSKIVLWTSSNARVAIVKDGKVTARAPGDANITVWLENGNRATCTVTVLRARYFSKCSYRCVSIFRALDSIGVVPSYNYIKKIATVNGIPNYRGTATQDLQMLNLLKAGKLIKP